MERSPWEKVVDFHGHVCPGLLIGYRAGVYALTELFQKRDVDEELMVIVENDSCSIDAIQVLTGCTAGKGNMIFKNVGKQAFTFIKGDSATRMVLTYGVFDNFENREAIINYLKHAPIEDLFEIKEVNDIQLPGKAQIFKTVQCSFCGEGFMESKARVRDGKIGCSTCLEDYSRGW